MLKIKSILFICLTIIVFGCSNNSKSSAGGAVEEPVTIKLFNISSYDLTVGDNVKLDYNSVDNATLSFVSSDAAVATVTETGVVSALKEGTAVIEMTLTVNGNTQKDTCTVNVVNRDVTFMGYQTDNVTLGINETITPSLIILPDNMEVTCIEYKIADSNIADVDINGAVTGKNEGQTVLTASYKNLQASINVIVTKNAVKVESISVKCPSTFLYQGDTFQLVPEIMPVDATNKNVIYSSDNKDVAIVYPSGLITAQNSGSAVITAVTEDGEKTAQCSVTVNQASAPLESISIDDYMIENGTSKFIQVKVPQKMQNLQGLKCSHQMMLLQ